ncbi:hypothetical protein HDK64DRAFT_64285 [Phyllosticta capitalensis]
MTLTIHPSLCLFLYTLQQPHVYMATRLSKDCTGESIKSKKREVQLTPPDAACMLARSCVKKLCGSSHLVVR